MTKPTEEERQREVLRRRAKALATRIDEASEETGETIVIVVVAAEAVGIPISSLSHIVATPPLAHLPGLPDLMRGLANVRGETIGVIDLGRWLGRTPSAGGMLAVAVGREGKLGLLCDAVEGVREVCTSDLAESFKSDPVGGRAIKATTKDLVPILDIEALLASETLHVGAKSSDTPALRERLGNLKQ